MEERTVPWLSNFIIFNPTLCIKEGQEEEKILFYHSNEKVVFLVCQSSLDSNLKYSSDI